MELEQRFLGYIQHNGLFSSKDKLLLAVSGGVDSTVLCELCHRLGFDFMIAHCNFRLRGDDSDRDEQFVKELAAKYNVPYFSKSFDTKTIAGEQKKSVEETARDLRYEWFHELLDQKKSPVDSAQLPRYIVTGHHADDNIETVVMHFFRGTGVKGMRGILAKNGKVVRPLLFARRQQIEDFARQYQLPYVADYTNFEDAFARNFFRNRVLPMVREFFPAAETNILRNIEIMREAEQLYEQAIATHKAKLLEVKGNEIHIPVLKLKKSSPLESIVYEIIKDFGFTAHQTNEVIGLLDSESGKFIASSTHRIIKNRKWLIIAALEAVKAEIVLIEDGVSNLELGIGNLSIERLPNSQSPIPNSPSIGTFDSKEVHFPLLLRKWKAGDYFYPLGMKKKKKLSRFLIDLKLSKTQKENVWVIESNKKIIWVVGYRIDERCKVTPATREILLLKTAPAKLDNI